MPDNDIIAEIHRHRAELARRCDYDIDKLMAFYRQRERESEAAGRKLVSFAPSTVFGSSIVREESGDK